MFTRNSQCVLNQTDWSPLLVFTEQLCEELNEFFREDRIEATQHKFLDAHRGPELLV